ncbi:hypothetical protein ACVMIH_004972 [Bradyrhizobium sp. USDA 4503]
MQNRHGLNRDIPAEVKRAVRQRDGFGCVVCGKAIYDYEHFDPEFADATKHDPEGIILLCISCHAKKTRGYLSNETIASARKAPKCKQKGFSFEEFDIGTTPPEILIGELSATDVETLIEIFGTKIFSISAPAEAHMPFTINALLTDPNGNTILRIVDNEWQSPVENWDVETKGGKIIIRRGLGDIILVIRTEPPSKLIIERLYMYHRGTFISCREGKPLSVTMPNGTTIAGTKITVRECDVGLKVDREGLVYGSGSTGVGFFSAESLSFGGPSVVRRMNTAGFPSRNSACPCDDGKKYKHCHGREHVMAHDLLAVENAEKAAMSKSKLPKD